MSMATEGRTTAERRDRRLGVVVIAALLVGAVGGAVGDRIVHPNAAIASPSSDTGYVFNPDSACVQLNRTVAQMDRPSEDQRRDTTSHWSKAQHCAYVEDEKLRAQMHKVLEPAALQLATMHLKIPEYHDEQRLRAGPGALGPVAGIFLSPFLTDLSNRFVVRAHRDSGGMLVAFVAVMQQAGEVLPPIYQALGLTWGINCIWLHTTDGTAYQAYVSHPAANQPCRPSGTTGRVGPLTVNRIPIPAGFSVRDNTPAARFTDDANGNPLLGVPCFDAWCDIGPPGFPPRSATSYNYLANRPPYYTNADGPWPRRETRIRGWYDEQLLEEIGPGGNWVETNVRATIVPRRRINDIPPISYNSWQHVADIYLNTAPTSTSNFFQVLYQGWNRVELMQEASGRWKYRMRQPGHTPYIKYVIHTDLHLDAPVPGTARWRYSMADPGEWTPCGENSCCPTGGT